MKKIVWSLFFVVGMAYAADDGLTSQAGESMLKGLFDMHYKLPLLRALFENAKRQGTDLPHGAQPIVDPNKGQYSDDISDDELRGYLRKGYVESIQDKILRVDFSGDINAIDFSRYNEFNGEGVGQRVRQQVRLRSMHAECVG